MNITRVKMARKPGEKLTVDDFRVERIQLPEPAEGEVLSQARFISMDPYLTRMMRTWQGQEADWSQGIIVGRMVSQVVASRSAGFVPGDWVAGPGRWQSHDLTASGLLRKLEVGDGVSPSAYLGVLGSSGLTAWVGIRKLLRPQAGEIFCVSSAAGVVGGLAGQLAKQAGARVVGIAGGPEKCLQMVDGLGFDACVDYHRNSFESDLATAAGGGIDKHFENVGAPMLDPVLGLMKDHGRIALCGLIAHYQDDLPVTLKNFRKLLYGAINLKGFRVHDHLQDAPQAYAELKDGIISGAITVRETVTRGLENAPQAYVDMLAGRGSGKHLVELK